MFRSSEAVWGGPFGRPSIGNAISGLVGLVAGAALMLVVPTGTDGAAVQTNTARVADSAVADADASTEAVAAPGTEVAGAAAAILEPTNERLQRQALSRSVRFGDRVGPGLPAWEEAAFEAALAQEANAAVQLQNPALILLARSRARSVSFGDTALTADQLAFVAGQEWWATQVETTGTTASW